MSASTSPSERAWAPGWYDDPDGSRQLRWFDGAAWSTSALPRVDLAPDEPEPAAVELAPVDVAPAEVAPTVVPQPRPPLPQALVVAASPASSATVALPTAARPTAARPTPALPALARPAPALPPRPSAGGTWSAGPLSFAPLPSAPLFSAELVPAPPRSTPLRRAAGRLAAGLPARLPRALAAPLRDALTTYAARTGLFRDRLTRENATELVFPPGGAWQSSVAACLGVLAFLLSLWPLVGLATWAITGVFAAWGLLRARHEARRGAGHAWFGVACGVGPLSTGLLLLAYH